MTGFTLRRMAVCAAALMTGSAAVADVTAQDVWDNWKSMLELYGEEGVSIGSETYSGGVLTVTDLVMSMTDEYSNVSATLPQVVFTENGDGTVSVAMSETYSIVIEDNGGWDPVRMQLSLFQSGMALNVSGTPDAMAYDLTADRYGLRVDEIIEGETAIPLEGSVTFNNVTGGYSMAVADLREIAYSLDVGSVDVLFDLNIPEEGVVALISGKIESLASTASMALPLVIDPNAPEMMFADGFAVDASYTLGSVSALFDVNDGYSETNGSVAAGGATVRAAMSATAVDYDVAVNGLGVTINSADMPFPIDVSLAEYGIGIVMPLSATDGPVPVRARVNLTDLAVNEELWSMIDPAAILPRDPATLVVDISGSVRMLFDLLDPASQMAMAQSDLPFEPHSVSLDALNVSVAGAQLTGDGAFTFDLADTMTIPGVPRPEGRVSLRANGVNGLVDKLVQMGLLPEDQVMGARMMMGMFATVTGDDQLESTLEINAQGHVIVNGQRIQ